MRFALALFAAVVSASPVVADEKTSLSDIFAQRFPVTLKVLEADFPDEQKWLRQKLEEGQSLPDSAQPLFAFELLKSVKDRYKERLRFAPVADQVRMLAVVSLLIESVHNGYGAQTCGLLARDGAAVLVGQGKWEEFAPMLDAQSAAYFSAVAASVEDPQFREEAADADWTMLARELAAAGVPVESIETVLRGDPADPTLCPSLTVFIRGVAISASEGGDRARSSFVVGLSGY